MDVSITVNEDTRPTSTVSDHVEESQFQAMIAKVRAGLKNGAIESVRLVAIIFLLIRACQFSLFGAVFELGISIGMVTHFMSPLNIFPLVVQSVNVIRVFITGFYYYELQKVQDGSGLFVLLFARDTDGSIRPFMVMLCVLQVFLSASSAWLSDSFLYDCWIIVNTVSAAAPFLAYAAFKLGISRFLLIDEPMFSEQSEIVQEETTQRDPIVDMFNFNQEESGISQDDARCAICIEDYQENEVLCKLPECQHHFHEKCLNEWVSRRPLCPLCKATIPCKGDVEEGTAETTEAQ